MSADLIKKLKDNGERITPVRQEIIEIFISLKKPITPGELLSELKKTGCRPNKTTVYRQLETLKKYGIIEEVLLGRIKRYELKDEHHHHAVCLQCGKIEDVIFGSDLQKQEIEIKRKKNFKVTRHSLEFFGICSDCQS